MWPVPDVRADDAAHGAIVIRRVLGWLGWHICNEIYWIEPLAGIEHLDSIWPDGKGYERMKQLGAPHSSARCRRRWLRVRP